MFLIPALDTRGRKRTKKAQKMKNDKSFDFPDGTSGGNTSNNRGSPSHSLRQSHSQSHSLSHETNNGSDERKRSRSKKSEDDPDGGCEVAAAALTVGVGSACDPQDLPGALKNC